jgi:flavin reductase (DIM6/NTAB) family NADH-FMN oxidoreductase RutF
MSHEPIKEALRMMPYGFYAVTSRHQNDVNIMVANWISQVAYEPRLVVLGLQKTAYSYGLISAGRVFAINIFRKEDADAIKPFTKSRAKNPDKVAGAVYTEGPQTGCPVLADAAAYLECRVVQIVDLAADHDIVVGEVVGAGVTKPGEAAATLTLPDLGWSYAG